MTYIINIFLFISFSASLIGCVDQSPSPAECKKITMVVTEVYEGGVKDVAFKDKDGKMAYINRALERGYTLEGLRDKTLHKEITVYLANTITGGSTNHIAQLEVDNDTLFTEFKDTHLRGQ